MVLWKNTNLCDNFENMHPVIQHILSRKGQKVPINDGRKIVLVLFGGLMTGVRGASVAIAFQDLGISYSFDSIYSASAGFLNASYMLSDNPRLGTSIYYDDLSGHKFLNFFRLWNVANIDYMINVFKNTKPIHTKNVWDAKTKLYVRLSNLKKHRPEYVEIHDYKPEDFFDIAKASVAIPYLHPGAIKIGDRYCKDGEFTDADCAETINYVLASDATDILVVYNRPKQKIINLPKSDRVYEICPATDWKLSRFETNTEKLKKACIQMGNKIMTEFGGGEFKI